MRFPQVINLNEDSVLVFDGDNVIDDTDQLPLGTSHGKTDILVDISWYDITAGAHDGDLSDIHMIYVATEDIWTVDLDNFTTFTDHHKYFAKITCADDSNMRTFKINEFAIDNEMFEATWMRLPYQIELGQGEGEPSLICWYDTVEHFGDLMYLKYTAEIYEGGVGNTWATDASRVTHRGPIEAYTYIPGP